MLTHISSFCSVLRHKLADIFVTSCFSLVAQVFCVENSVCILLKKDLMDSLAGTVYCARKVWHFHSNVLILLNELCCIRPFSASYTVHMCILIFTHRKKTVKPAALEVQWYKMVMSVCCIAWEMCLGCTRHTQICKQKAKSRDAGGIRILGKFYLWYLKRQYNSIFHPVEIKINMFQLNLLLEM